MTRFVSDVVLERLIRENAVVPSVNGDSSLPSLPVAETRTMMDFDMRNMILGQRVIQQVNNDNHHEIGSK